VAIREKEDVQLSEQAEQPKKVKKGAIPEWAEGLYYNKGIFSEVLEQLAMSLVREPSWSDGCLFGRS
jgi:hypothetical protein